MWHFSRIYVVVIALASAGVVLLLLDHSEYDSASEFRAASECADTSSAACFQLYPGVIQSVRRAQTSDGEQDAVTITSRGRTLAVSLRPSPSDAHLIQVNAPVTVEWYVGLVATVWIGGQAVPTTANLAEGHTDFAFIGLVLLWLAGVAWGILIVNRRMAALISEPATQPHGDPVPAVIRPKPVEMLLLPLLFSATAWLAARPLLSPELQLPSSVVYLAVVVAMAARLALGYWNERLIVDGAGVTFVDWRRRKRQFRLDEVERVRPAVFRWTDWSIPSLVFVGRNGARLFAVNALSWDIGQVAAAWRAAVAPPGTTARRSADS